MLFFVISIRISHHRYALWEGLGDARAINHMVKMAALTIPMDETVSCIAFSPHQDSSDLLAVGTTSRIAIKSCRIKVRGVVMTCTHT